MCVGFFGNLHDSTQPPSPRNGMYHAGAEAGLSNTPLTPYLDKELLYNNDTSVDGTAVEATGFTYRHPTVTQDALRAVVQGYIDRKLFPAGYLK